MPTRSTAAFPAGAGGDPAHPDATDAARRGHGGHAPARAAGRDHPLGRSGATDRRVVRELADERLLVTEGDSVDVAHEALIQGWPTLREWLDQDREGLREHRRLTLAAEEWQRLGHDPSALYRGVRLDQALAWREKNEEMLNAREREFVDKSVDLRDEERARERAQEEEREAQQQRELEQARSLAKESEARRKAEADRAEEAERGRVRQRNFTLIASVLALASVVFGSAAGFFWKESEDQRVVAEVRRLTALSFAISTIANGVNALPLEERTMRLWEVLAAVHARRSQKLHGLDSDDPRLVRADRLSRGQALDALRSILTSSVWPTRPADPATLEANLPSRVEARCARGPGDAPKGFLLVSGDEPTRRLFFVPVEGAVYVADSVPGADGGCRIGEPVLRLVGKTDVKADPALRVVVEMSNPRASQDGAAARPPEAGAGLRYSSYNVYGVQWSCRDVTTGGPCAKWHAELVPVGSFYTELDDPKAWSVIANGGGFKVIERDGKKRGGMEYAAPFDPVSPADPADVASYFAANVDSQESCVAQFESVKRASPAGANGTVVAPVKQLREAQYCAEIGSLSATDMVVNVYALPVSWQVAIASEARDAKQNGGSAMTAKRHLLRFPAASFAFQSPQIRRAAFGEQALEGYLILETAYGTYFTLLWGLDRLHQKGCDILNQPAVRQHLERVKYTTQGRLTEERLHAVFAFLAAAGSDMLATAIDAPCETGAPSLPALQR